MTADGQLWFTPALIGLASIALGIVVAGAVRRRNLKLIARAQTAEAVAQRVRVSEERFRRPFEHGADPQLLCDGQRVIAANPAAGHCWRTAKARS